MLNVGPRPSYKSYSSFTTKSSQSTSLTSYVAVTNFDITLDADANDVIMVGGHWSQSGSSGVNNTRWNLVTMVGGSAVSALSGLTTADSLRGWLGPATFTVNGGFPIHYRVKAVDLDGGQLTIRLLVKVDGGTGMTINADINKARGVYVINLGPSLAGLRTDYSSPGIKDFGADWSTTTNPTATTTTYAYLQKQVTVAGSQGDLLGIYGPGMWLGDNTGVTAFAEPVTYSGSAIINYCSGLGSSDQGVAGWAAAPTNSFHSGFGNPIFYTVQSNDVIAGNVIIRLYGKVSSAATRTYLNDAPAETSALTVVNYGRIV